MGGGRERNGRTEGRMEGKLGRREKGRKGTKKGEDMEGGGREEGREWKTNE